MTFETRTRLTITAVIVGAILLVAGVLIAMSRQAILDQTRADGELIARLLARTAHYAESVPDMAERAMADQMLSEATILAHLVAVAEAHGETAEAISRRLRAITATAAVDEIRITDSAGHAYLSSVPNLDFTFSPDPAAQPQAHEFWALLTGARTRIVQEARRHESDDRHFKHVGVAGIDRPRIVQVGYAAEHLADMREHLGVHHFVAELLQGGGVTAVQIVDPEETTLALSAVPGVSPEAVITAHDREILARAAQDGQQVSYIEGDLLKVVAPIRPAAGAPAGAVFVVLSTARMDAATHNHLLIAGAFAALVVAGGAFGSGRLARRVSRPVALLTRFFAPVAAKRITAGRHDLAPGKGDISAAAILFTDLRGFTRLAREHPTSVVLTTLTAYQRVVVEAITRHGGSVDKFLGDGVMATFGIDDPAAPYAADAFRAARDILAGFDAWNARRVAAGETALDIGLAVTTGEVIFGTVGEASRLEFTVIGDAVNLAAKLEKHNKAEGTRGVATAEAYALAGGQGLAGLACEIRPARAVQGVVDPLDLAVIDAAPGGPQRRPEPAAA